MSAARTWWASLALAPGVRALRFARLRRRNESADRAPSEVEPGLWLGGVPSRRTWTALEGRGVTRVLSLFAEERPEAGLAGVAVLLWLPVPDREAPTAAQLASGCHFLHEGRRRREGTFVYCGSGMGRAPTMVAAWRIRERGEDAASAIAALRAVRPVVDPTAAQRDALAAWQSVVGSA